MKVFEILRSEADIKFDKNWILRLVNIMLPTIQSATGSWSAKMIEINQLENLPKRMKLDIGILFDSFENKSVPMFHFQSL